MVRCTSRCNDQYVAALFYAPQCSGGGAKKKLEPVSPAGHALWNITTAGFHGFDSAEAILGGNGTDSGYSRVRAFPRTRILPGKQLSGDLREP